MKNMNLCQIWKIKCDKKFGLLASIIHSKSIIVSTEQILITNFKVRSIVVTNQAHVNMDTS